MFQGFEWYPSLVYEGMFEQPTEATQLLKNFLSAHGPMLAELPQKGEYKGKYYGNPYDPSLRKAHKEREEFVLGALQDAEKKRFETIQNKNNEIVPQEETLGNSIFLICFCPYIKILFERMGLIFFYFLL